MSSSKDDSSLGAHSSQAKPADKATSVNHQARLFRIWADIGEVVLVILTCTAAVALGRRLALLANATLIPDAGTANARGCAAALDMTEDSFKQLARRRFIPTRKPGDELLYRLSDLTQEFQPPPDATDPIETKHGRCAKKIPRPPRGKRQGKK